MPFLPSLRRQSVAPVEAKAVTTVAFADYYSDLAAAGIHRRAKDWPIERAVTEGYDRIMWVFKSVNTIGADSARLPYRLRQGDDIVDDHPMYRVLNQKANPVETGQVFRKRLSAQVLLSKRGAFCEITKSNGGSVVRLDLLPPDRVEIIPSLDGSISHYRLTRRDGTIRNIEPDRVRWFRDPHPIDPYMGVTPLESAGLSIELDHFARLYNVAFMQNDGRPGGVLAVRDTKGGAGDLDQSQMDRIESRFGKGPVEAGKLSVIAGDLSYVDLAARPRDMQYGATSKNAKIEILSAFGVPESVLGYSAERTYDNADAELYTYFTRTLPAHWEILLTGFDEDSEDDLEGFFDTEDVEVLERAERAKREEARTEVAAGLRSIKSYVDLAGYGDEVADTPFTRALYIPQGKTPLPSKEEDAEALGLAGGTTPGQGGQQPGAPAAPAAPEEAGQAPQAPAEEGLDTDALAAAAPAAPAVAGAKARPEFLHAVPGGGEDPKARAEYRLHRKAAEERVSDPAPAAADALETQLAVILAGLADRWVGRTVARLQSPKQRKHTRHWAPEYDLDTRVGTKALDAARAVDEDTWEEEATEQTSPVVEAAAVAAAGVLVADLGGTADGPALRAVVAGVVGQVVALIGRSAVKQAQRLAALVNDLDQAGETLEVIVGRVRGHAVSMASGWATGLATQAATATVAGARDDAARALAAGDADPGTEEPRITREWWSRRDGRVRFTHAPGTGADGQTRWLDEPFIVGDALLRYPGDPLAPPRETANCRCHLRYRAARTGRYVPRPVAAQIG